MTRRVGQFVCFLILLTVGGCKGMFGPQGMPSDPLFASRKPSESKAIAGPPVEIRFSEPAPPTPY